MALDYSLPADPAVGAAIREKRQARGWSVPRLAVHTGLNADYLRAVERRAGAPPMPLSKAFSKCWQISQRSPLPGASDVYFG